MKSNARKNKQLVTQYPFLKAILAAGLEPLGGDGGASIDGLTIRVEKADGYLMYRYAENIGLGGPSNMHVISMDGKHRGQVLRKGEYLFTIGASSEIINRLDWPRNSREARGTKPTYARNGVPIPSSTVCLVWVTVEAWYEDTGSDTDPFGKFRARELTVTVYGPPEGGFQKLVVGSSPEDFLVLNTDIQRKTLFESDPLAMKALGGLDELCRLFQDEVFFKGMREVLEKDRYRSAYWKVDDASILYGQLMSSGYAIRLESSTAWVSFHCSEDKEELYVASMYGTLTQLRALIKRVVQVWRDLPTVRRMPELRE